MSSVWDNFTLGLAAGYDKVDHFFGGSSTEAADLAADQNAAQAGLTDEETEQLKSQYRDQELNTSLLDDAADPSMLMSTASTDASELASEAADAAKKAAGALTEGANAVVNKVLWIAGGIAVVGLVGLYIVSRSVKVNANVPVIP